MFRTELQIPATDLNLSLQDKIVTIGSCFAEVIGAKLQHYKADVLANPFGTIFNPVSVSKLLLAASGDEMFNVEHSLVQRDGIWYSYDLHSSLSHPDKEHLIKQIEKRINQTYTYLREAKLLVITLGTAVSYELTQNGAIVANCHKLPANHFKRSLLTVEQVSESIEKGYLALRKINPKLKVILTVSPVRHLKETLPINSVSKSILRVATHAVTEKHPDIAYFPAYEVLLDDLRDYRFYGPDMLHPTPLAEDYIWQKFTAAYLAPKFQEFIPAWDKISRALSHRPFHPEADAHQSFIRNTLTQLHQLSENYGVDIRHEELALKAQLLL